MSRIGRTRARLVLGAVVAAASLAGAPAWAQPGGGRGDFGAGRGAGFVFGGAGGFVQQISTREWQAVERVLGLTDDQKALVGALFEGYSEAHRDQQRKIRDLFSGLRERMRDGDRTVFDEIQKQMESIRQEIRALESSFLEDVKSVLSDEQLAQWPRAEMTLRRERTLRRGLMSGERVDVVRLVEDLGLSEQERAQVEDVLRRYEEDLDRALVERNRFQEEAMSAARSLMESGDMEAMEDLFSKGREYSKRVRDINRRYAREVMGLLSPERAAAFDQAVKRASFPEAYRPSFASRRLEAALGLADLTPEQAEAIESLRTTHERKWAALSERLAAAIEASEESFSVRDMFDRFRQRGGERPARPGDEVREERRALEQATTDSLNKILTPEQIRRLPARDEERRDGFQRGQRGGDRGGRGERF